MSEAESRFAALRRSADPDAVAAIERLVREAPDRALNRINLLEFAAANNVNEEKVIAAFLHASQLGLFDMSWNLLCPGCGGILDANATLKTVHREEYHCALCDAKYEPTLDDMVEVSFTVSPRLRRIAAHDPNQLPFWDYTRQLFWSSGIEFSDDSFAKMVSEVVLGCVELPAGEKSVLSLQLPDQFIIVFDPMTHSSQFFDVKGEPTTACRDLSVVFNKGHAHLGTLVIQPGPVRLTLENRTSQRALPAVYIAGDALHHMLAKRKQFLTAKRLLTNQTFRDIYRTDALDVDQQLKITSLSFLFTDLKGSTELYDRVGDLVAYDLVKAHFGVLNDVVAAEAGAVVKTIGDAVMATFSTPERALAAALHMRRAMLQLNAERRGEDMLLKIGIHEGPCLAVTVNDRLDYFGQTVNIAARVQGLAMSRSIFATEPVVQDPGASRLLSSSGLTAVPHSASLRGIADKLTVYEIA
jgi:class 3 adenylate cyclase